MLIEWYKKNTKGIILVEFLWSQKNWGNPKCYKSLPFISKQKEVNINLGWALKGNTKFYKSCIEFVKHLLFPKKGLKSFTWFEETKKCGQL